MVLKQISRLLGLKSPLGEDVLLLTGFTGREEISRLFSFQLEMISDNNAIAAKDIVGKPVSFHVKMRNEMPRHFHGIVSRFLAGDENDKHRRIYRAEVVPWLWFLTLTTDCRIFQNKNVPDIIEQIFKDLGFNDFQVQFKGAHPKRDYCVQYRETDFSFVSRLMEEEGIFYFFKHEAGKHVLVISDHKGAYYDCIEKEVDYPRDSGSQPIDDYITSWEHRWEFRTGKIAQTDYNFETPSKKLMTNEKTVVPLPGMDKFENYDFPGGYGTTGDGQPLTKTRMEESEVGYDIVDASSYCKSFTPGGKFKTREHRSSSEKGKSFVITSIDHAAEEPGAYETGAGVKEDYTNRFTCIPDSVIFRPARLTAVPFVQGPQTAVVVGPGGEEIYTDKHGRVKVQFFWDREGKKDENSSCWMRVSQIHAGKSFGGIDIPRIGEEVIVSFLEGDPDLPIITGRVYHAENMPPFGLPGAKVISGMKSNSTKGGGGYNEYVLDDTKGTELIREHGQFDKDSTIQHDLREHVLHDRSRDVTNNETILVGNDRTETVSKNETLTVGVNRTESVGSNETLSVGADRTRSVGANETVTVTLMRTHTVGINEAITVGAAQEITVGGLQAITVGAVQTITVGVSQSMDIGTSQSISVGTSQSIKVGASKSESVGGDVSEKFDGSQSTKIAKKLSISAGDEISLVTGSASILMKKDGTIQIKGKDILIQGSGKITEKADGDVVIKGSKVGIN